MSADLTLKGLVATALVLVTLGAERLVSAHLIGIRAPTWPTRVLVGVLCLVAGSACLAMLAYTRFRARR